MVRRQGCNELGKRTGVATQYSDILLHGMGTNIRRILALCKLDIAILAVQISSEIRGPRYTRNESEKMAAI